MASLNFLEAAEDQIYSESMFGKKRAMKMGEMEFTSGPKETLQELQKRKNILIQLLTKIEELNIKIERKAKFRSNALGLTISSILFAQLAFVTQGTFVTYSWDIMEPISYMIGMFNFTCGFGWYYMFITKPDSQNATDWLQARIQRRMLARQGITSRDVELLKTEIDLVQKKLDHLNL